MLWPARAIVAAGSAALSPSTGGDPYISNVVFLAGLEGSDGATSYSEEKNSRAATFAGNAQLDTAQFEAGASSLLLDGTGDYITFADNGDWTMGSQFTMELSVRYNSVSDAIWISQFDNSAAVAGWMFGRTAADGMLFLFYDTGGTARFVTASWTPSTNTWYKVAVDRDGSGDVRLYVDGAYMGKLTLSQTFRNSTKELTVGRRDHGTPRAVNGWIDEVRITNGIARYASDSGYTPAAFQRF
jgi:hypothetical protein